MTQTTKGATKTVQNKGRALHEVKIEGIDKVFYFETEEEAGSFIDKIKDKALEIQTKEKVLGIKNERDELSAEVEKEEESKKD